MATNFQNIDNFKMALVIVKDYQANEYNYIIQDFSFGFMPPYGAGSWTETYDVVEDGDNKGTMHFTRYIFEAATPLSVRRELNQFLNSLKAQFENNKVNRNERLWN